MQARESRGVQVTQAGAVHAEPLGLWLSAGVWTSRRARNGGCRERLARHGALRSSHQKLQAGEQSPVPDPSPRTPVLNWNSWGLRSMKEVVALPCAARHSMAQHSVARRWAWRAAAGPGACPQGNRVVAHGPTVSERSSVHKPGGGGAW